ILAEQASGALSPCNPQFGVTRDLATLHGPTPRLALTFQADPGHDLRSVHLFRGTGAPIAWTEVPVPPGLLKVPLDVTDGERFRLLALLEDADGNVECAPGCGLKVAAGGTLAQARDAKAALGGYATFAVDLQPPEVLGIVSATPLGVNGVAYPFTA